MANSPIIDPNCEFGAGLTDSEIQSFVKSIPELFRDQGFACSNAQTADLDNTQLGSYFTGLFAQSSRALSILHENEDFARCFWDNFLCSYQAETRAQGLQSGTYAEGATVTITYPNPLGPNAVPVVTPFYNGDLGTGGDAWWQINPASITSNGFTATLQTASGGATSNGFSWIAQSDCP